MSKRIQFISMALLSAAAFTSVAHADGRADESYPQAMSSMRSRDEVRAEVMRGAYAVHPTEVLESQPAPAVSVNDRAQVLAEEIRINNSIHPTEVLESQPAPAMHSAMQHPTLAPGQAGE